MAKPFLKWAGGKSWLIEHIEPLLPPHLLSDSFTYVEPFVGSGAMLFWFLDRFPKMEMVGIIFLMKCIQIIIY
jgi:DNA adenine methylase